MKFLNTRISSRFGPFCLAAFVLGASVTASVAQITNCYPPPSGLVGWWPLNGDLVDVASGNNGLATGSTVFTNGEVGQALFFNGANSVRIPQSPLLNVGSGTGFTVELWINPVSLANEQSLVEWNSLSTGSFGNHLTISTPGLGSGAGSVWGTLNDTNGNYYYLPSPAGLLATNTYQHIAWTWDKASGLDTLYLNGARIAQTNFGSFVTRTSLDVYLGLRPIGPGSPLHYTGRMDEVSIYNRALSVVEIRELYTAGSYGKCDSGQPPAITLQPTNVSVVVGGNASFSVECGGTPTLTYAWKFSSNSTTLGTNATLTLTNVQKSQAGLYFVQISNLFGVTNSTNALLTVTNPAANLRVVGTNSAPANSVIVPIQIVANGNENGLSFSLGFQTSALNFAGATLGSGAAGGFLSLNTNLLGSGDLGCQIVLPPNTTLNAGTQEVLRVVFNNPAVLNGSTSTVFFTSSPVVRQLTDAQSLPLAATYSNATVAIVAATGLEGDVSPRPGGDRSVTLSDWLLVGQFVAGLASTSGTNEFQRADCAPRSTGGDGQITACDFVQAGRYANGLDPATPIGGPVSGGAATNAGPSATRIVSVANGTIIQGQAGTLSVMLASQGNENGLGFSLHFDPSQYVFGGGALGGATSNALYILNTNNLAAGQIGVLVALPSGSACAAGPAEVFRIMLQALPGSMDATSSAIGFTDQPVFREVSDAFGIAQPASYTNATLTTHPLRPTLAITPSGTNVVLSWPLWATNFGLSAANGALPPTSTWSNLNLIPTVGPSNVSITLTNDGTTNFFRLHNP